MLDYDTINSKSLGLKLCDFGLGAIIDDRAALKDFCGSPGFFAPEILLKESYSGDKADIWSIGCILLEMILGRENFCDVWMSVFDKKSLSSHNKENFCSQIKEALNVLRNVSDFSDDLKDFLFKILNLIPSERPSAGELLNHPWLAQKIEYPRNFTITKDHYPHDISPINSPVNIDHDKSNSKRFVLPEIKVVGKDLLSENLLRNKNKSHGQISN